MLPQHELRTSTEVMEEPLWSAEVCIKVDSCNVSFDSIQLVQVSFKRVEVRLVFWKHRNCVEPEH